MSDLREAKDAADIPVMANTGVKHETVAGRTDRRRRRDRRDQPQGRRLHVESGRPGTRHRDDETGPRGSRVTRRQLKHMAKKTKLFFATDVHGSEMCFRKFLNAGAVYGPDVLVLGGDIAGKAVQAVEDLGGGRYTTTFRGHRYEIDDSEGARAGRAAHLRRRLLPVARPAGRARRAHHRRDRRRSPARSDAPAARAVDGDGRRTASAARQAGLLDARQRRPAIARGASAGRAAGASTPRAECCRSMTSTR